MEGGRRMTIGETMVYPFTEAYKSLKTRFRKGEPEQTAIPAE